nr:hypothetical protein [uncultured Flavobacterium sp.]
MEQPTTPNKSRKHALLTLTFYFAAIVTAVAFNVTDLGGPCTPGSGIIVLLTLPIITFILFTINLIMYLLGKEQYKHSVTIHLCVLTVYLIVFMVTTSN